MKIDPINWNEEWEKNLSQTKKTDAEFDILIEPKMSFGTGHHETTHMMIQHLLETEVTGMKTLDMGCGTAILAILAEMKGAQPNAIDIDNWCYLNSIENAQLQTNYCLRRRRFYVEKYDFIANINRNILLNDMQSYVIA
jgi:ribosomal protein L11 methyltransferase